LAIVTKDFIGTAAMKTLERIRGLRPPVSVVFVSMSDDAANAAFALRAGIRGFLTKSTSGQIVEALKRVSAGQIFVAGAGSADIRKTDSLARAAELLSERELEVFALVGQGLSSVEIANRLGLSRKTSEAYMARVKEKLAFKNIIELRRAAFRWSESRQAD